MGEHLLPGKLTFSGAGGVDRLRIPIIRVCPPQERGRHKQVPHSCHSGTAARAVRRERESIFFLAS